MTEWTKTPYCKCGTELVEIAVGTGFVDFKCPNPECKAPLLRVCLPFRLYDLVRCPKCRGFNVQELFVPPPKYACLDCFNEWEA